MFEITSLTTLLFAGISLGFLHALEGDHVAAVLAMSGSEKNTLRTSFLGVVWGVGHTATLFAVGLMVLVFKLNVPIAVAYGFEILVGMILN